MDFVWPSHGGHGCGVHAQLVCITAGWVGVETVSATVRVKTFSLFKGHHDDNFENPGFFRRLVSCRGPWWMRVRCVRLWFHGGNGRNGWGTDGHAGDVRDA